MPVCLVTGGAGFIGSHLVEALVKANHLVRVVDDLSTGTLENLSEVIGEIEFYPGDLLDATFLARVMRGVELVFHVCGPGRADGPLRAGGNLASATLRVLYAALEARARRLLIASSADVYGQFRAGPVGETDLVEPLTPIGRVMLSSELACAICTQMSGLETVRLRYFNVFGPRQPLNGPYAGVVREVIRSVVSGYPLILPRDEQAGQDLIYVEDAVHAALLASRAPRVAGKVYNIASGRPSTNRQVVETINLLGYPIEPIYAGNHAASSLNNIANMRRAEVDLGFCAATDLRTGLSRCLAAAKRPAFDLGMANTRRAPFPEGHDDQKQRLLVGPLSARGQRRE